MRSRIELMFDTLEATRKGMQVTAQDPQPGSPPGARATFCTRIKDRSIYPALDEISEHLNHAQRHLFVDRYVHRKRLAACKKEYLVRFGITARQFNAIARDLRGKVRAAREACRTRIRRLRNRIAHLDGWVHRRTRRLRKEQDPKKRLKMRFALGSRMYLPRGVAAGLEARSLLLLPVPGEF
jgi:hypothetical protein